MGYWPGKQQDDQSNDQHDYASDGSITILVSVLIPGVAIIEYGGDNERNDHANKGRDRSHSHTVPKRYYGEHYYLQSVVCVMQTCELLELIAIGPGEKKEGISKVSHIEIRSKILSKR